MAPEAPDERRVVTRRQAAGRLRWLPPFTRSWLARRRERHLELYATVEDVSVSGARLVVPRTAGLEPGAVAGVEAEGHLGNVEVRWVEPHEDADLALVGVEFAQLSPELQARINDLVAEGRKESIDWRWEIAR
jgi:hypothetical protein